MTTFSPKAAGLLAAVALTVASTGDAMAQDRTIAFSPPSMDIPAMQQLTGILGGIAADQNLGFISLDPKFHPGAQAQQLTQLVSSGKVQGAWVITVRAPAMRQLLAAAVEKGVALVVTGRPADYGLEAPLPGIVFSDVNAVEYGQQLAGLMAECVTEKLDGKAEILFFADPAASRTAQERNETALTVLAEQVPGAVVVATANEAELMASQQKAAQFLQAHPNANAVFSSADENALGALQAFKAAGKPLPCLVTGGGSDPVAAAVEAGDIYAAVQFDFPSDVQQKFEALMQMMAEPGTPGRTSEIPLVVIR